MSGRVASQFSRVYKTDVSSFQYCRVSQAHRGHRYRHSSTSAIIRTHHLTMISLLANLFYGRDILRSISAHSDHEYTQLRPKKSNSRRESIHGGRRPHRRKSPNTTIIVKQHFCCQHTQCYSTDQSLLRSMRERSSLAELDGALSGQGAGSVRRCTVLE
jgi:hypothetical protein